ncbi:MAG: phosphatase PAP2 family protein [Firmicutes bacterium]|nr:phosphatase PAP2 family protein [Bacillota bacterium]
MEQKFDKKRIIKIIVSVGLFAVVSWLMMSGRLEGFDHAVQNFFFSFRRDWLTTILVPFSYSGNWPLPTVICAILLAIPKTRTTFGVPMSVTCLSCVGIYQALKYSFQRPRPDVSVHLLVQNGYSFPSGHSLTSLVAWTMLILLFAYYYKHQGASLPIYKKHPQPAQAYIRNNGKRKLVNTLLIIYIVLMGLSRIYVGVHWPSDVFGSWILGLAVIEIMQAIFM